MNAKEKFQHMTNAAREAVEDFRDDLEDRAIVWAAKEIQSIRATTADEIYNMVADWFGNHNAPQNILGKIRQRYGYSGAMKTYKMHVAGPDDIIAFSDELEALQRANEVNKKYLADRAANPDNEVLCIATVTEVESE